MRASTKLRELLRTKKTIIAPGCYNAMSAKVLETVGFDAIYMTGYGTSLSLLGMPDAGLATMGEMQLNARYIANAVSTPVIADSDNGYGNAINVVRTVREYIQTGVAAIHLEDQILPKRCGHVAGRRVVAIDEAVGKIRAADKVRRDNDPDFVLIARTDARGAVGGSLDEAIKRANAYLAAGADLAFVEGPVDKGEVERVCREVKGPVFYNMTGISPRYDFKELEQMGIAIAILPGAMLRVSITAMYDFATKLRDQGTRAETEFDASVKGHPVGNLHAFAGFDEIRALEEQFLPPEDLEKYQGTVGHMPAKASARRG
jgi:2-methylisocitrate lyase-like PEP mutase family enzyme